MDIREAVRFGFSEYFVSETLISKEELKAMAVFRRYGKDTPDYYKRLRFQFPNGYGASVIRTPGSYGSDNGQWEVAVIRDNMVCYTTIIAQDVIGFLDATGVHETLTLISQLQPREHT